MTLRNSLGAKQYKALLTKERSQLESN